MTTTIHFDAYVKYTDQCDWLPHFQYYYPAGRAATSLSFHSELFVPANQAYHRHAILDTSEARQTRQNVLFFLMNSHLSLSVLVDEN